MRVARVQLVIAGLFVTSLYACGIDTQPMPENPIGTDTGGGVADGDNGDGDGENRNDNGSDTPPISSPDQMGTPIIDPVRVFHSGPANGSAPRLISGHSGAVARVEGEIRISNITRPEAGTLSKASSEDGSFNATFDGAVGDTVLLEVFELGAGEEDDPLDATTLRLQAPSVDALDTSTRLASVQSTVVTVSPPNASGLSTIVVGAGTVDANTEYIAANTSGGNSVLAVSEPDGSIVFTIAVASNDRVELFGIDAKASNGGGPSTTVRIP